MKMWKNKRLSQELIIEFCIKNKRLPSLKSEDEWEKRLAGRMLSYTQRSQSGYDKDFIKRLESLGFGKNRKLNRARTFAAKFNQRLPSGIKLLGSPEVIDAYSIYLFETSDGTIFKAKPYTFFNSRFKNWRIISGKLSTKKRQVVNLTTGKVFRTIAEAGASIGVTKQALYKSIKKKQKSGGFYWEYVSEVIS